MKETKRMKKMLYVMTGTMIIGIAAAGSAVATVQAIDMSKIEDLMQDAFITKKSFLTDSADTYDEYQTIYYGADSHIIKQIDITDYFKASAGYTMEYLEGLDINQFYPGFTSMDFAEKTIVPAGDYFVETVSFKNLDQEENVKAMVDNGIIALEGGNIYAIDADSYIDVIVSAGAVEKFLPIISNSEQRTFLIGSDESVEEYQTLTIGKDTGFVEAIETKVLFQKSAGYTMDSLSNMNMDEYYPGFSTMDFARVASITDDGDYFTLVIAFDRLDVAKNVQAMLNYGLLRQIDLNENYQINAESFIAGTLAMGGEEI